MSYGGVGDGVGVGDGEGVGEGVGVLNSSANNPGFSLVSAVCGSFLEAFNALMPTMTIAMVTIAIAETKNNLGWMRLRRFFFFFGP